MALLVEGMGSLLVHPRRRRMRFRTQMQYFTFRSTQGEQEAS